ncbi:hypothetical protein [Terriglobus sp. RCC_193]|uniref:hypothetical protein n=1 Tax=Terriglobus sp. RCC_193 TaxID=3239218 RepID=UPI00352656CD
MTQALHIFRKDLRHQWIELALYLELLILVGFLIPIGWPGHWTSNGILQWFRPLVVVVPVFWLAMITRLIHDEALVGNRQFWTTRPYRWTSLLGAKLLFLLACIALPYFVMQWCLALYGGVSPFVAGFLVSAAKHVLIIWIPLLLIACITSTFASTFFTTLASLVVWTGMLVYLLGDNGPLADAPFVRFYLGLILTIIFTALLVLLYHKRNVQLGRILMGCTALFFLLLIYSMSNMAPASLGTLLLKARYHDGAAPQLHLHYVPAAGHSTKHEEESFGRTAITLPIELLGLPNGNRLHNAAVQYSLKADEYSYTSPWNPTTLTADGMMLHLPSSLLKKAWDANTHLSLSLAAEEIAPGEPQTTDIRNRFAIPGGGSCDAVNPPYESRSAVTAVVCRFAYSVRYPMEIDATMAPGCAVPIVPMQVSTHEGNISFDPLIHWPVNFGPRVLTGAAKGCQVQSLTTTVYHPVMRFRTSLEIPSIRLADYLGH